MDKEQARFILRSFRPDGADVDDGTFAEALALAHADRELGEWLANERAFDGHFARALATIHLPESLRADILRTLAVGRGDFPQAEDSADAALIGAFASIHPPPGLRGEIIAAMKQGAAVSKRKSRGFRRFALPLAAAAGVALAFLITRRERPYPNHIAGQPLPVSVVRDGFIRAYESPFFTLDTKREDHRQLIRHLKSKSLPCPGCLPPGLVNVKGIGCRELVIDGRRGSLICFDEREAGTVHLVIFSRADVSCELPAGHRPEFGTKGSWSVASWGDDSHVFVLIGSTGVGKLEALF
jgi:hypothetical protein